MIYFVFCTLLLVVTISGTLQPLPHSLRADTVGLEAPHLGQLLDGIERICPDFRSSNYLILDYNEDITATLTLAALNRRHSLLVQNSAFTGKKQPWFTKCVIGFFNSTEAYQSAEVRFPYAVTRILVFPDSQLGAFVKEAPATDTCLIFMYHYDPDTLTGAWFIFRSEKQSYTMESFARFTQNMEGYRIDYMTSDIMRDHTYDRAIGRTIAQRHNGSFVLVMFEEPERCIDYYYGMMYAGMGHYVVLPEMTELCFLVPRSSPKSVFLVLLDPYDAFSWAAFGLTVCVVATVLTAFGESLGRHGPVLLVLEVLMSVINGPTHKFRGPLEKRIIGLFLLMCIVLISGYQSLVISFMSAPRYEPELDTVEQINDTCRFQFDLHAGSLGFNFKNIEREYATDNAFEAAWARKMCALLPCSEAQVVTVGTDGRPTDRLEGLGAYSEEELEMVKTQMRYFRYSKARMQSRVAMYHASSDSPVRHLLQRYTGAFVEGQLYHFPVLQNTKRLFREGTRHVEHREKMGAADLLVIWVIYVGGMVVSGLSFVVELCALGVRKLKGVQWMKRWNTVRLIGRVKRRRSNVVSFY